MYQAKMEGKSRVVAQDLVAGRAPSSRPAA